MAEEKHHLSHIVPSSLANRERLRIYIPGIFPLLHTNSAVKKALKKGLLHVNGAIADSNTFIHAGDRILFRSQKIIGSNSDFNLDIIYKDEFILIVNKPPGLVTSGNKGQTLQHMLSAIASSEVGDAYFYPMLAHRLDKATCGLMIACRTATAKRHIDEMFFSHRIEKYYTCIIEGYLSPRCIVDPIDGLEARTEIVSSIRTNTKDATSILDVKLHTGRTHQIRIHLSSAGHPIVGDPIYNKAGLSFGRGLFLMAHRLRFVHPMSGKLIDLSVDLHPKFHKYQP